MKLNKSCVLFNEEEHTYTLEGVQLSGITSLLHRQLFADKYDNVPESVLKKAAQRGKAIHKSCELYDECGMIGGFDEVANYATLISHHGLRVIASEWLIDDGRNYASAIDKVFDDYSIGDIKTTSELDIDYLRWQLSIYAYMLEAMNPGLTVPRLFAIWLRGDIAEIREVDRIDDSEIIALMDADRRGERFNTVVKKTSDLPAKFRSVEHQIVELELTLKKIKEKQDELKKSLLDAMQANDVMKWETDSMTITRKKESIQKKIDTTMLKTIYPDIYSDCLKEINVKESILIKLK